MEWYIKVIKDNYANFEGRARRQEYWMFTLIHYLIIFSLVILGIAFFDSMNQEYPIVFILVIIYVLATFLPSLAVTVRRLHDTNRSGWYYLVTFIPYVGGLWLFILTIFEGDKGPNNYGKDPKGNNFDEIDEIGKTIGY